MASQLNNIPDQDNLLIQLEQFKMGLTARATGGEFSQEDYKRQRKLLLSIPNVKDKIPRFIRTCRSVDDFWQWIKNEAPTYAERRLIISEGLNPILEEIEYESSEGSLELQRTYEEKEIIGEGGFGLVYKYEHKLLHLPFAVKIFAPSFHKGGDKELERFFQEARILFSLSHPSIIRVYDAGLIGQRPFIRMEYFEGKNLNQILIEHGRLSSQQALKMMEQIVSGMEYAHETIGIIHRDLKPSNIMATKPSQCKIIDFGLGIFIENELHSRLTKTGEATISGYYNAPELVENPKLIDKRSDIYSLGALWFTMLTGQPPAGTSLMESLNGIDGVNTDYAECIKNCLANIELRTLSCTILLEQIKHLSDQK